MTYQELKFVERQRVILKNNVVALISLNIRIIRNCYILSKYYLVNRSGCIKKLPELPVIGPNPL